MICWSPTALFHFKVNIQRETICNHSSCHYKWQSDALFSCFLLQFNPEKSNKSCFWSAYFNKKKKFPLKTKQAWRLYLWLCRPLCTSAICFCEVHLLCVGKINSTLKLFPQVCVLSINTANSKEAAFHSVLPPVWMWTQQAEPVSFVPVLFMLLFSTISWVFESIKCTLILFFLRWTFWPDYWSSLSFTKEGTVTVAIYSFNIDHSMWVCVSLR